MQQLELFESEMEISIYGKTYQLVEGADFCTGCAFYDDDDACCDEVTVACSLGRNQVWKEISQQ